MNIHVTFRPQRQADRAVEIAGGSTVAELIVAVGETVDVMVAVRRGVPIPDDEVLTDGESVMLLSAASGG